MAELVATRAFYGAVPSVLCRGDPTLMKSAPLRSQPNILSFSADYSLLQLAPELARSLRF